MLAGVSCRPASSLEVVPQLFAGDQGRRAERVQRMDHVRVLGVEAANVRPPAVTDAVAR
jgi:hypothetical protein